jgi:SAM-dependent methyltransferase
MALGDFLRRLLGGGASPASAAPAEDPKLWRKHSLTRYAMYRSIEGFLSGRERRGRVLLVSERNEGNLRAMFEEGTDFTATSYPETDAADLSAFPDASYDYVLSDQVLEHVAAPWTALEQMRAKLKPGGIAVNTSCAFYHLHDAPDYYRFTPEGFRYLHERFIGQVLLLDWWGNREAIADYAATGRRIHDVRSDPRTLELARRKDPDWPWIVWCAARKPES